MIVLKAQRQNWIYRCNIVDDVLIIFYFHEMSCSFQQTFVEKSPLSFSLSRCQKKKRNYPCFSLMLPQTIFYMKMRCNVFFPHVLLTRRQFQRLKYSICPSVYTDDLIFTRKNRLIIATCCLYCRTIRLSINTGIYKTHKTSIKFPEM